jgi:dihydrolipoamide dehydrogenase
MPVTTVDSLVIGAGPGGYHAAIRLGQLGQHVVCVDRDEVGGVCLNRGCIPTKALLHVGEVVHTIGRAAGIGIDVGAPRVDRDRVARFSADVVAATVGGVKTLFRANGVTFVYGTASFVDPHTVQVQRHDGGVDVYAALAIVIATGAAPIEVAAWPRDGLSILDSDDAVALPRIPRSMLIVGGGAVGLEFATIYSRLGTQVLVVEMLPQLVAGTDLEVARALERTLAKQGIEIALETRVTALARSADGARVTINGTATGGRDQVREVETVLVAVGRRPVTDGLNLAAAGLAVDAKGFLAVNAGRMTAVEGIYAIGDVTGPPLLAHKAMREGVVAAEAIAGLSSGFDPTVIPNCVYTDPELATVGFSEEAATAAGYDVRVGRYPLAASGRARTMDETDGLIKLVADAKTDVLLGMHILAPQAESLIGEGIIALEMSATIDDIALSIHPHPTLTEGIMTAAEAIHGKAIDLINAPAHLKETA